MEAAVLAKWNKDKLIQEILKQRENKRSSLDTSNLQQDEITELKKDLDKNKQANRELQTALDNSKSLYDQTMSEIVFVRGQNEKMLTKNIDGNKDKETKKFYANNRQFFPKFVPRFTKHLVISDSTYKFAKQGDINNETAIHSYPSATISDANNIMDSYSAGSKPESLVCHLGHNAFDQGTDGKRAAEQMGDLVSKCLTKFKPHKVAICLIPQVKNGLYGLDSNNKEIYAYNQEINSIADQIRGEFQCSNVYVLNYGVEANDIRQDGGHLNIYELKNSYNFAETYEKYWQQLFIKRYIIETNAS